MEQMDTNEKEHTKKDCLGKKDGKINIRRRDC